MLFQTSLIFLFEVYNWRKIKNSVAPKIIIYDWETLVNGSSSNTLMVEIKTAERRNTENDQIEEASNETTLDVHDVPVNSISNPEITSTTGTTHVTFVAHNFFGTQYGFGLKWDYVSKLIF